MEIQETSIPGLLIIDPLVHGDSRGFFVEMYQQRRFADAGITAQFVQDNLSRSGHGTLRGLHYQIKRPQGKLISVLSGEVFDVVVDLRRSSPAFGTWLGMRLTAEHHRCMYVPPGCAHGFYVLSESADFFYKCTDYYAPEHERTLAWNDPDLAIDWPLAGAPTLSEKDRRGVPFKEAECYE